MTGRASVKGRRAQARLGGPARDLVLDLVAALAAGQVRRVHRGRAAGVLGPGMLTVRAGAVDPPGSSWAGPLPGHEVAPLFERSSGGGPVRVAVLVVPLPGEFDTLTRSQASIAGYLQVREVSPASARCCRAVQYAPALVVVPLAGERRRPAGLLLLPVHGGRLIGAGVIFRRQLSPFWETTALSGELAQKPRSASSASTSSQVAKRRQLGQSGSLSVLQVRWTTAHWPRSGSQYTTSSPAGAWEATASTSAPARTCPWGISRSSSASSVRRWLSSRTAVQDGALARSNSGTGWRCVLDGVPALRGRTRFRKRITERTGVTERT